MILNGNNHWMYLKPYKITVYCDFVWFQWEIHLQNPLSAEALLNQEQPATANIKHERRATSILRWVLKLERLVCNIRRAIERIN